MLLKERKQYNYKIDFALSYRFFVLGNVSFLALQMIVAVRSTSN